MATVRFSQELKDEIIKRARNMFHNQLLVAQDSRPSHDWGDKIYNILFAEHIPTLNAVNPMFLKTVDSISIDQVGSAHCNLKFELKNKRAWPYEFQDSEYAKRTSTYGNDITLKDHLVWGELFAEVKAWRERIATVNRKRDEFVSAVDKVISAHATLAPALKMWPPLWDLVPDQYKDRHREVKERVKRDVAEEIGVDLGALTAAVVAHKITR